MKKLRFIWANLNEARVVRCSCPKQVLLDGEPNEHAAHHPSHGGARTEAQAGERLVEDFQGHHFAEPVGISPGHNQDVGDSMEGRRNGTHEID